MVLKLMNDLDKTYTDLLQDILDNGIQKGDRTGTGTLSVFGRQIRHKMSDGFPLLTTKKMAWKTMVTELLWFLRGDTNIKYLVDNNCHIWDGDAYKNYCNAFNEGRADGLSPMMKGIPDEIIPKELFIDMIKNCDELGSEEFAKKWGELGKIYGFQWRNWGGHKEIKQTGFLHKTDNGWTVKWSDLHSFANGTEWMTTLIQDSDQSLYSDEDEGKKIYYKNIILGYDEKSYVPIYVAKVIDDKFDKYVGGVDQIANLINDLKTNPDSRRLMVNAWNVADLPVTDYTTDDELYQDYLKNGIM
jgi:thymidylate synthase